MVLDDGNVALAYDDVGRGTPPVLLIHGMSCNRRHWDAQVEFLSTDHRVVAYDQRGHGESSLAADGVSASLGKASLAAAAQPAWSPDLCSVKIRDSVARAHGPQCGGAAARAFR